MKRKKMSLLYIVLNELQVLICQALGRPNIITLNMQRIYWAEYTDRIVFSAKQSE